MKISDNITYAEAIHSQTAKRKGIDNTPNPTQVENMKLLAEKVFEPLRKWVGGPIKVNSFFRSPELNTAIGGVASSQHCKGQAIDIDDVYGYKTNAEMYHWVKENLNFDQMIWEFGTDMNPNWVHISYVSEEDNRNRCLKAYKDDMGRTKYKTNAEMYAWVKENLNFDQMIWEFGTDMNPNWVHISYVSEEDNRNRCLKAYKDEYNKTKYKTI